MWGYYVHLGEKYLSDVFVRLGNIYINFGIIRKNIK